MLSPSTATFSATMPASSTATITIQSTPPATRGRAAGRERERGRAAGWAVRLGARLIRGSARAAADDTLGLRLHRNAEPARCRANVDCHLGRCRANGFLRHQTNSRFLSAHAHREIGRAGATARLASEEALHDPIFERVEADDSDAPAWPQHAQDRREGPLQRAEFVVDLDPKGLEDPPGRMPVSKTPRSGNRFADRLDQLRCPLVGLL